MSIDEYEEYTEPGADSGSGRRRSGVSRGLRAFSGAVAAGVVVLAVVVVGTAYLGGRRGFPGPGEMSVGAHIVAAVAVVVAQWFADHRRGAVAVGGSIAVLLVTTLLLWTQWWG
ncbi:hypothetical protein [Rhodococcus sp. NPDC127528]|uniref:hypothetical protein n=1 Tax=unclassified Rhodococcus (in: high G+C Gram-positive bacteria) TaxID=192944 RepID=UPI0036346236